MNLDLVVGKISPSLGNVCLNENPFGIDKNCPSSTFFKNT